MLERLARLVMRRHWLVAGIWVVLTIFGAYSAVQVSDRWLEDFSIPGYSAYEANQRVAAGVRQRGDPALRRGRELRPATSPRTRASQEAIDAAAAANPGSRLSSYFNTGSDAYVSADRQTTFAEIYPAGEVSFEGQTNIDETRQALADAAPAGVTTHLTGYDALYEESSGGPDEGPSVLVETLIGGLGALVILLFTFGTLPAIVMPLLVALTSILNTFTLIWIADLHHRRLDHRAVPRGADRARGGDRLLAADDLPLPRGAQHAATARRRWSRRCATRGAR